MTEWNWQHTQVVLAEVKEERERQHEKWGEQDHPDYCSDWRNSPEYARGENLIRANNWKLENARRVAEGSISWDGILLEEIFEALSEEDPARLREELVQSSAVITAWVEAIDRRASRDLEEELAVA